MSGQQLPGAVGEFGTTLQELVERLDPDSGWCQVFWQRDPEGMAACVDGREVPPWDVVESLIHDLAEQRGPIEAERESARVRALHRAAVVAHDAREGTRELLGQRLAVMRDELHYAAGRQQQLGSLLDGADPAEAERLRLELAWSRDDHERASARCLELSERIAELELSEAAGAGPAAGADGYGADGYGAQGYGADEFAADGYGADVFGDDGYGGGGYVGAVGQQGALPTASIYRSDDAGVTARTAPDTGPGFAGRGEFGEPGALAAGPFGGGPFGGDQGFAASTQDEAGPDEDPLWMAASRRTGQTGGPFGAAPSGAGETPLRGRAGAAELLADSGVFTVPEALTSGPGTRAPAEETANPGDYAGRDDTAVPAQRTATRHEQHDAAPDAWARWSTPAEDAEAQRLTAHTVATLAGLRAEGRGDEAHGVLCGALGWPAARLPLLAAELQRAGLGAQWVTLLWEAASMPPDRLAATADALAAAGRVEDGRHLLRQGASRPVPEIAEAVLALDGTGRTREADALLDACLRVRAPQDCAALARCAPGALVPRLLHAARGVSAERHRDLSQALRQAGLPG